MKSKKLIQTFQIVMSPNEKQTLKVSRKFELKCVFYRPEYSDFFSKNEDSRMILAMYTWFYPYKTKPIETFWGGNICIVYLEVNFGNVGEFQVLYRP